MCDHLIKIAKFAAAGDLEKGPGMSKLEDDRAAGIDSDGRAESDAELTVSDSDSEDDDLLKLLVKKMRNFS